MFWRKKESHKQRRKDPKGPCVKCGDWFRASEMHWGVMGDAGCAVCGDCMDDIERAERRRREG